MASAATNLWNRLITLILNNALESPAEYSGGVVWAWVTSVIMDWFMVIGLSVMNIIIIVEVIRASMNLKQNITVELLAESGIKLILANGIMILLPDILSGLFDIAKSMASFIGGTHFTSLHLDPAITAMDDMVGSDGSILDGALRLLKVFKDFAFSEILGLIFILVVIVCLGIIFVTLYSRMLNLFILTALSPIAVSTIPGTGQISQTAYAFFKTLLAKTFEIVVIVLAMYLGALIANAFMATVKIGEITEGILMQMGYVILITASAKGADTLLRRAFNL